MGAGSGYWASLVQQAGGIIQPWDNRGAHYEQHYTKVHWGSTGVIPGYSKKWTLLLCWPWYQSAMAYWSLRNFRGNQLIYIGEQDGCTGDAQFSRLLDRRWKRVLEQPIPVWWGMHDWLMVYERRRRACRNVSDLNYY